MNPSIDAKRTLQGAGLRATRPRIQVLKILRETHTPQSAQEITKALKSSRVDIVTVYRTLEAFIASGLAKKVDLRRSCALFEYNDSGHHHHHIVCRSCGKVEDVEGCDLSALEQAATRRSKHFSSISSHALEFFGDCRSCVPAR